MQMPRNRLYVIAALMRYMALVGMLVGIAWSIYIRFYNIGADSYWFDEYHMAMLAQHRTVDIFTLKYHELIKPVLYPFFLSMWTRVFGDAESVTRSFSLIIGILASILFADVARRYLRSTFFTVFGVFMYTSTYSLVWASRQVSYYTMVSLWSILCLIAWQQFLLNPTTKRIVLLSSFLVLGFLTHYLFAIFLIGLLIVTYVYHGNFRYCRDIVFWFSVLLIPYIVTLTYRHVSNTYIPFTSETLLGIYTMRLFDPPGNISYLFHGTVFQTSSLLLLLFGGAVLYLFALSASVMTKAGLATVSFTLVLISICFMTPLRFILTGEYYFHFIIPGMILSFTLIFEAAFRKGLFVVASAVGILYCYINVLASYHGVGAALWEYRQLAGYIVANNIGSVAFHDCSVMWITQYYLKRDGYSGRVHCYTMQGTPPRDQDMNNFRAALGMKESDEDFWERNDYVVKRLNGRQTKATEYQRAHFGLMVLKEYNYEK